jgi:hypothetical protein
MPATSLHVCGLIEWGKAAAGRVAAGELVDSQVVKDELRTGGAAIPLIVICQCAVARRVVAP